MINPECMPLQPSPRKSRIFWWCQNFHPLDGELPREGKGGRTLWAMHFICWFFPRWKNLRSDEDGQNVRWSKAIELFFCRSLCEDGTLSAKGIHELRFHVARSPESYVLNPICEQDSFHQQYDICGKLTYSKLLWFRWGGGLTKTSLKSLMCKAFSLPETNSKSTCQKIGHPKRKLIIFQPSIFRCQLADSFREGLCFFSSAWSGKRLPSKPFAQDGSTETTSKGKNCNGGTYHEGQGCFAVRCGEGWVWLVQLFSHQKRGRKKIDVFSAVF